MVMKFLFYIFSLSAGDFAILFMGWYFGCPVVVSYILGGLWGYWVGYMGVKEWNKK